MKKFLTIVLAFVSCCVALQAQELLRFSQTSFDGWNYTCPGTELSKDLISQNRVYLYKDVDVDYTLVSPVFSIDGVRGLKVDVEAFSTLFDDPAYNATKGSPTVELLDAEGNVLQSVFNKFTTKELERNFSVSFNVGDVEHKQVRLRFACWEATMKSALSVRRVFVNMAEPAGEVDVVGDVNNDGSVTASDVTALYNYILNNDKTHENRSDVNGDGSITSSDVTAVYNIILGIN